MRVRVRFQKLGKVRWTSHRDLARAWERAIRRVGLPIAYSQGFSPHPKVHFGLALSTGHESLAEYIDLDLDPSAPTLPAVDELDGLAPLLSAALPVGVDVMALGPIPSSTTSLQQAVVSCDWRIEVRGLDPEAVAAGIAAALAAPELMLERERKGKAVTDDVRPYMLDLAVVGETDAGTEIDAHLATQPRGLRAGELLRVIGPGGEEGRVRRLTQWTLRNGARSEPLAGAMAEATSAPHAQARAS